MARLGICIGAQKAGTTWLYRCLLEHPEITCAEGKELHFFSRFYRENLSTYWESFPDTEGVLFESSPSYLSSVEAPARIAHHFPEARLIVLLRDPVERTCSHFRHLHNNKKYHGVSLSEAIDHYPALLSNSYYGKALERYLDHFSAEQILVLDYEELSRNPNTILESVCAHLSVSHFTPSIISKKYHSSASRAHPLYNPIAKTYLKLRRFRLGRWLIRAARAVGINQVHVDQILARGSRNLARVSNNERLWLAEIFLGDQERLTYLLQRYWQHPPLASSRRLRR